MLKFQILTTLLFAKLLNCSFVAAAVMYKEALKILHTGSISCFNSTRAEFGFNYAKLHFKSKNKREITELTLSNNFKIYIKNIFSYFFGFLISLDNSGEFLEQSFAPTLNVGFLNYYFDWGYMHGDISNDVSRHFMTVSYNVPFSKISDKGSYRLSRISNDITTMVKNSNMNYCILLIGLNGLNYNNSVIKNGSEVTSFKSNYVKLSNQAKIDFFTGNDILSILIIKI